MSEEDLLARVARSDAPALRELYDLHGPRALGVAQGILGAATAAEDVLEDTFVDVWYRAVEVPRGGDPSDWIAGLAQARAEGRLGGKPGGKPGGPVDNPRANEVWARVEKRLGIVARPAARPRRSPLPWVVAGLGWAAAALLGWMWLEGRGLPAEVVTERDVLAGRVRVIEGQIREAEKLALLAQRERNECRARVGLLERRDDGSAERRAELLELLEQPGTRLTPLTRSPGNRVGGNAVWNTERKRLFIAGSGFVAIAEKDYELWLGRGDRWVPAGLIQGVPDGRTVIRVDWAELLDGPPEKLSVTVEEMGGNDVAKGPTVLTGQL